MAMDLGEFVTRLERFIAAGATLKGSEAIEALRVADVLKRLSRQRAADAIAAHPLEPAVMMHMGDGWGAWCNTSTMKSIPGTHLVVTRIGEFRHEFLLQPRLCGKTFWGESVCFSSSATLRALIVARAPGIASLGLVISRQR